MKLINTALPGLSLLFPQMVAVQAFQPPFTRKNALKSFFMSSSNSKFSDLDPVSHLDLKHAHDCAENVGECSIEELEDMKQALKTERLQHQALGLQLDPEEELDHRLLEKDLTLQLALLKNEMETTSLDNLEKNKQTENQNEKNNPVAAIANPEYYHHDHTLKDYVEQGEELFLMPNGLSDAIAFGTALLLIGAAPFLVQN